MGDRKMRWLITGGAGFIGTNLSASLLENGHDVVVLDDLSRRGSERNLNWLSDRYDCAFVRGDIRDPLVLPRVFKDFPGIDVVSHQAAQVAVTKSVVDPRADFETNALGTLNVLEALRGLETPPTLLFSSTNKVYGGLDDAEVRLEGARYEFTRLPLGIPESWPLDFHSPYGCSKGAADQYVRDFARIYQLPTVVFRQSCIYGRCQFGVEDQGWVAWFLIAAALGREVTVYGNGNQARDLLWVDDLTRLYLRAADSIDTVAGEVFNVGGGSTNVLSVLELIGRIQGIIGVAPRYSFSAQRPGDQPLFVSDNSKATRTLGWEPSTTVTEGLELMGGWITENLDELRDVLSSGDGP